jgi:hypothetical protein
MTNRRTIKFRVWDIVKKEFTYKFPRLRYDYKQDAFEIGDIFNEYFSKLGTCSTF